MREILNVRIIDGATGRELADIDGTSTADALAYFLRSRGIDSEATADLIWLAAGLSPVLDGVKVFRETIIREERCPILGRLDAQYVAEVH